MTENDSDLLATLLEKLSRLRQNGTLSEEEFHSLKILILQRLSIQVSGTNQDIQTDTEQLQVTGESKIPSFNQHQGLEEFLIYENPIHKFKMKYPRDWEGIESVRYYRNGFIRIIDFGLPYEKSSRYKYWLTVEIRYFYSKALSLDTYVRQRIFLMKRDLKDVEIIESSQMVLSNHDGYRL